MQRLESPAIRFVYVVAQPGSGVSTFLSELTEPRAAASTSIIADVDRLSEAELAQSRRVTQRMAASTLLVATASDPTFPQPFPDAGPGELCIVTDDDLAFTQAEITEFFALSGIDLDAGSAAALHEMTGGWAAGVSYALRLWQTEGKAVALDASARSYHGLRVYINDRILGRLRKDELGTLVATVATARAGTDVLRQALPATNIEVSLASLTHRRLLLRDGAKLTVPRIVAETVLEQYHDEIRPLSAEIAERLAENGNYEAAAHVSFCAGFAERGVAYLLQVPVEDLLAHRLDFQYVAATLSDAVLCAHPILWFATLHWRRHRVDLRVLIAEGQMLLETFGHSPTVAVLIKSALHIGYCEAGEYESASAFEDDLAAARDDAGLPAMARASIAANFATTLSLRGRITEAARELQTASRLLVQSPMLLSLFMQIHVRKARIEGNWFAEKAFHERAIAAADESGEESAIALALMEACFGALVARDEEALALWTARMRGMEYSYQTASFEAFARIRAGIDPDPQICFGLPRLRGAAALFRADAACSADEACAHLEAAIREFDASGSYFGRIVARVAMAQVSPQRQAELIAEAKVLAEHFDWLPLHGALSHLAIGELPAHNQPLRRFAGRMRRLRETAPVPLRVSLLRGAIECDDRALAVSPVVLLLLAALAVRRRPVEREELCEMLWPDARPQEAAEALKLTVRAARVQCGDSTVVRSSNGKFALGAHVQADVEEIRHTCEAAFKDAGVFASRRSELHAIYDVLASGRAAELLEHEWFVGTEAVLMQLQMRLGEALARDCIERADFTHAAQLSARMLQHDPCDEIAWELVIRGHLAAGAQDLASRALREYRRSAAAQMQTPHSRIEKLLA